jgi:4-aminobutyrate aminotransferase
MLTLAGNPVSVAAGLAVLRTIVDEELPARAAMAGKSFQQMLREALAGIPEVGEIRGVGLAIGIELVTNDKCPTGNAALARSVVYRAWELGAVFYYVGSNVLELTPPLTITDHEIGLAVDIIGRAIRDAVVGAVDMEEVARFRGW